jgi:hypothetical protein
MNDKPAFLGTLLVIALLARHAVGQPPAEKNATQPNTTVINSDFSQGDFAALGWKVKGEWDVFRYPKEQDVECRRPDFRVQGRRLVRQLRAHLG